MSLYINPFSGTTNRPGPRTPQGRAISARNATTHGLFSRDVVLPALGEDPQAYQALSGALSDQIGPANLLERHYAEAIAAASWRLRRLHRWQAQLFEDTTLSEDERLDRLDRVLRHETALHRQIDRAVRMLARDVPQLFEARARKRALADYDSTERDCRDEPELEAGVCRRAREHLPSETLPAGLDLVTLDNTQPVPEPPAETTICQNEPPGEDEDFENEDYEGFEDEDWDEEGDDADPTADEQPTARAQSPAPPSSRPGDLLPASENDKTNPPPDPPKTDDPEPDAVARARQAAILRANILNALYATPVIRRGSSLELPAR